MTDLVKSAALWAIARDVPLPLAHLDRVGELIFLKRLLDLLRIDCVLDVGANRGQFARELRGIGYPGWIVSFEPVSSEFAILQAHFADDSKWRGFHAALGSREGSLPITIPRLTVMSSLLESQGKEKNARTENVRVMRLDGIFPSLRQELGFSKTFLKMDTQGFDLEVFRGGEGIMDQISGLQSELSIVPIYKKMPHYLEALQAYEAAGFDLYNLSVVNRVDDGGVLELNGFLLRR